MIVACALTDQVRGLGRILAVAQGIQGSDKQPDLLACAASRVLFLVLHKVVTRSHTRSTLPRNIKAGKGIGLNGSG